MFKQYPDVVTVGQLCKMMNIGKNTAYDLVNRNVIKSVKIGRIYKIPKTNIIRYLKSTKQNFDN